MKLAWVAAFTGLGSFVALAATSPFDFTGHWSGTALQSGQSFQLCADLTGTKTFTGTLGVGTVPFNSCTVEGRQGRRVTMTLACLDGSKATVKGRLDPQAKTITGQFHSSRKGHHKHHGSFSLSTPGACVPTGGDCTSPADGGGEAAVCCNGDCSRVANPDGSEGDACN
jgi:hypothetical protein